MESVKEIFSNIFPSTLFVIGNAGLTAILFGLEYLVDKNSPCPCDPKWNTVHTVLIFIVPALVLLLLSMLVLPNSRILLKCGTRIQCLEQSVQIDSAWWDCMETRKYFIYNTLMQMCVPPVIWIVILLLDGDYVACLHATAVNRTQIHLCEDFCSLEASSDLLNYCHQSRISGELVLLVFVFILVMKKFCPTWLCSKRTQDDYYQVKYERLLEKKKRDKIKKELETKVEETANEKVKDLISKLKLDNNNQLDEQQQIRQQITNSDEAAPSEPAP